MMIRRGALNIEMTLRAVRGIHCYLETPVRGPWTPEAQYSACLLVPKTETDAVEQIQDVLRFLRDFNDIETPPPHLTCMRDGDTTFDVNGDPSAPGHMRLYASRKESEGPVAFHFLEKPVFTPSFTFDAKVRFFCVDKRFKAICCHLDSVGHFFPNGALGEGQSRA